MVKKNGVVTDFIINLFPKEFRWNCNNEINSLELRKQANLISAIIGPLGVTFGHQTRNHLALKILLIGIFKNC